jgi:hypothetical protein
MPEPVDATRGIIAVASVMTRPEGRGTTGAAGWARSGGGIAPAQDEGADRDGRRDPDDLDDGTGGKITSADGIE